MFFFYIVAEPLPLMDLCRLKIRQTAGKINQRILITQCFGAWGCGVARTNFGNVYAAIFEWCVASRYITGIIFCTTIAFLICLPKVIIKKQKY